MPPTLATRSVEMASEWALRLVTMATLTPMMAVLPIAPLKLLSFAWILTLLEEW
jgi:hypothetical protein